MTDKETAEFQALSGQVDYLAEVVFTILLRLGALISVLSPETQDRFTGCLEELEVRAQNLLETHEQLTQNEAHQRLWEDLLRRTPETKH